MVHKSIDFYLHAKFTMNTMTMSRGGFRGVQRGSTPLRTPLKAKGEDEKIWEKKRKKRKDEDGGRRRRRREPSKIPNLSPLFYVRETL